MSEISSTEAANLIEKCRQASEKAGIAVSIAIVDSGGNLLAFLRMDGALLASIEVSQVKAKTALFFGTETRNLPADQPFTPALLSAVSYPIAFLPGGIPVRRDGRLIGAIGVGGGIGQQDQAIAESAIEAFE